MSTPNALIGYTGFVGGTIVRQHQFECLYNSQNIEEIQGKDFDVVVCAAAPGIKWKANKEPEADWAAIERLIENLKTITARQFILISTIDVYSATAGVDEDVIIQTNELAPYGKHRRLLEEFAGQKFKNRLIVRLPGLFGEGLKKNPIFDLMHNSVEFIDCRSVFQFYNLANLWADIIKALEHRLSLINLVTEPIRITEIAQRIFNQELTRELPNQPAVYDIRTKYAQLWEQKQPYLCTKEKVLTDLTVFKEVIAV